MSTIKNKYNKCYISLSFDDGRDDNYIVALPILEKYDMKATFNIATGYIDGSLKNMPSPRPAMTCEQIETLRDKGHELAGHGHMHRNDVADILLGISKMGGVKGFASPGTGFSRKASDVEKLKKAGIEYIRISMRYGRWKKIKVFCRKASRVLRIPVFSFLYRIAYSDSCMDCFEVPYIYSVPVMHDATYSQLKGLIDYAVSNKKALVLMFHSILNKEDVGYNDPWTFEAERFDHICALLASYRSKGKCKIVTSIELIN